LPLSTAAQAGVEAARARLAARITCGEGPVIAIVGPCSIHSEQAALEYAERLLHLQQLLRDRVQLVMRVYLEKPRTTVGWKGFLYDPDLNGTDDLLQGLQRGRRLMTRIAEMGVPIATELLDPIVAPYLADCLTWVAIGARTTESQIHRQLASSLPCPVGFKNGTDGSVNAASSACIAASRAHTHLGVDCDGRAALLCSAGNQHTHVVLRGGHSGPNFDSHSVQQAASDMSSRGLRAALLVDCSHGNSEKDYRRQPQVARSVMQQMRAAVGDSPLIGLMLESHLCAGSQPLDVAADPEALRYGVSVTDGCIDFATTEALLSEI
jgi:3-deoxy-7-phosphoheptulonate synthase